MNFANYNSHSKEGINRYGNNQCIGDGIPDNGIYIISPVLFTTTNLALQSETNTAGSRVQIRALDRNNKNQMFYLKTTTMQGLFTLTSCTTNLQMRLLMNSDDASVPIVMDPPPLTGEVNVWGLEGPIPQQSGLFAVFNLASNNLVYYDTDIDSYLRQTGSRFPGTSSQFVFIKIS